MWFSISPINPINDLIAIITKEVAIALFMLSLLKRTRTGIIIKPPPAPTSPVINPTTVPSIRINNLSYFNPLLSLLHFVFSISNHCYSCKEY